MQLGLNLIYRFNPFISLKNTKTSNILVWNKKYKNQVLINIL